MSEFASQLLQQLSAQSGLEALAVVLALAYVWLAAKQNIWCWPCALLSTAIYTFVFWEVTLPFHALLNVYYMLMAVYGWLQWQKDSDKALDITSWTVKQHIAAVLLLVLISVLLSVLGASIFDSAYLYLDAFITVFSVFTTVLVAKKVRENWLYWIVIDAVAVYLYLAKGLLLTGLLFVIYSVFAIYGYLQWSKSKEKKQTLHAVTER
ncbi:nicotinamide riboside transporter PnuC [Paraglaciecola sp.]|uniref:nicotinamide riboside transporter PnuC n=1 Tax=Paraglaciecola sp. TaxID=1920173 RepID=UPI00273DE978|nr:nicotinamide riboside transporter PnuC [Paraglaciecola sp.]MDP5032066.1 nicotinamide riboside transporter PnuC [Paraglaciecola sp.]